MKPNLKTIIEQFKTIALTSDEKASIRAHLYSHMGMAASPFMYEISRPSPWHMALLRKRVLAGFVILLLVASTGVSFAAEGTLPGDTLYPIKINITEEVRSAVTFGTKAKVTWEKNRVVKRVIETETLLKQKSLTPARQIEAQAALVNQLEKFSQTVAEEKANPVAVIEASADLEPTLKAHQDIIANLSVATDSGDAETQPNVSTDTFVAAMQTGINIVSAQESDAIEAVDNTSTKAELTAVVDIKISDAEEKIDALGTDGTGVDAVTSLPVKEETIPDAKNTENETKNVSTLSIDTETAPLPSTTATSVETSISPSSGTPSDIAGTTTLKTNESVDPKETLDSAGINQKIKLRLAQAAFLQKKKEKNTALILAAKEALELAKEKKSQGDLKEALRLVQIAYKNTVEVRVSTSLESLPTEIDPASKSKTETTAGTTATVVNGVEGGTTPAVTTPSTNEPTTTIPGATEPSKTEVKIETKSIPTSLSTGASATVSR